MTFQLFVYYFLSWVSYFVYFFCLVESLFVYYFPYWVSCFVYFFCLIESLFVYSCSYVCFFKCWLFWHTLLSMFWFRSWYISLFLWIFFLIFACEFVFPKILHLRHILDWVPEISQNGKVGLIFTHFPTIVSFLKSLQQTLGNSTPWKIVKYAIKLARK